MNIVTHIMVFTDFGIFLSTVINLLLASEYLQNTYHQKMRWPFFNSGCPYESSAVMVFSLKTTRQIDAGAIYRDTNTR